MEEQKLGNCNGIPNGRNVVERKKDGILKTPIGFSTVEMSSLTALCNALFPSLPLEASGLLLDNSESTMDVEEFYRASLPNGWSTFEVAETMKNVLKAEDLKILKMILWLLSTSLGTFLLAGKQSLSTEFPFVHRFGNLGVEKREEVLLDWSTSSFSFFRIVFKAFKIGLMWNHFTRVDAKGRNPFWKAIDYSGPEPAAMAIQLSPKPLEGAVIDTSALNGDELDSALQIHGCKLTKPSEIAALANVQCSPKDHAIECDAVIIGSGCGGGVAAAVLAKAGFKVVVLEKGGYRARHELELLEGASMRELYEGQGFLTTEDQNMFIMAGSTVGGGSAVNWSASFRTPDHVVREWTQTLGLQMFGSPRYQEAMDRVCERLGVQEGCEVESFQNAVLRRGCEALGFHVGNIPRNASADHYCGWCTFGCRRGAKQATSETWLVDAADAGAVILTRCSAHRVLHTPNSGTKGRKAIGVAAKIGGTERQLFIRARATLVASGALRTPPLLHASGLKNPNIGKNLHLHPVQMVWGYFPPGIAAQGRCYEGGIMTAFSREPAGWDTTGYGGVLQTPILHPGFFASAMPWRSAANFKKTMLNFSRTCNVIVLLRDMGSGTVAAKADGSLRIDYKLRSDDKERARDGVEKGLRVLAAAGAAEVGSHHQDLGSFKLDSSSSGSIHDNQDFEEYVSRLRKKDGAPMYCAHQMGSCRMGMNSAEGAVDENGESWEVEGLYVADGSVLPTALGVNPMITIQSFAYCIAHNALNYLKNNVPPN